MKCPHCEKEINIGALMGSAKSKKKSASSAENGKKGGRPVAVVKKANIVVTEHQKSTKKVPGVHLTGWTLSYTFNDGRSVEKFYQAASNDLKNAKHLFFKVYVEPNQNG